MAGPAPVYPTTETYGQLIVEIESTTTVGTFAAVIGFDQKALTLTAATSEANLPPIGNEDAPSWTARGVSAKSLQITGSGVLAKEDQAIIEQWYDSAAPRRVRVRNVGIGYRVGLALLTNLGQTASRSQNGNLVQRSLTIDSAGPFDWTAGDPA